MRFQPDQLEQPIVQAPMGGGPSTVALAAAVAEAGGLAFLAAGYKAPEALRSEIAELRSLTDRPFGVNVFAPPDAPGDAAAIERYVASLAGEAELYGVPVGAPHHDDDAWEAKLALLEVERVAVVSFTFGCPARSVVERLQRAGSAVWATVTTPEEARLAAHAGADALVVQGVEAGGHRGSFASDAPGDIGLLALLQLVAAAVDLPLVAAGGIADGRGVAAVLAAGADAAALGTALMRADEAGTSGAHRVALEGDGPTALTRAFTGRTARGIANRFMREHDADAATGYPDIHHVTAPLRAAARGRGDADGINLWAGQAYALAPAGAAADIVRTIATDARRALAEAARRHGS